MIHINRNRENLGKFNDQEVADGLKSGRFLPTDLAWREPMPSWQPLSTFTDLPEPSSEESVQIPVQGLPSEVPENIEPAWERTTGLSLGAAMQTVKQVFSAPTATFQNLPATGGIGRPLFFYTIVGWISGGAAIFYQLVAASINPEMFLGEAAKGLTQGTILAAGIVVLLFLPLFLVAGAFLWAAIVHLFLMITGAGRNGFEATFRALAYSSGATSMLQIVPLCGGYLYPVAHLVYGVIALREIHRTDLWRVVLSMVLIMLLCCGAFLGIAMGIAAISTNLPK
ncbi:MAG: GYF domain-containing protein [Terrimicrobiaceae bacterium]